MSFQMEFMTIVTLAIDSMNILEGNNNKDIVLVNCRETLMDIGDRIRGSGRSKTLSEGSTTALAIFK
jgi:hypothetical protein